MARIKCFKDKRFTRELIEGDSPDLPRWHAVVPGQAATDWNVIRMQLLLVGRRLVAQQQMLDGALRNWYPCRRQLILSTRYNNERPYNEDDAFPVAWAAIQTGWDGDGK